MAIIKCKMCGGDLELIEGSSVAVCEYCGSQQTVPAADNEKKLTLFARANRLRLACEFDKAAGVYESIVADFPTEAEAYWGLVLCRYGIEYVDDPATGKKIPTCHRSSFDSVMEDSDFEQALENADAVARRVYRDEAKAIEELRTMARRQEDWCAQSRDKYAELNRQFCQKLAGNFAFRQDEIDRICALLSISPADIGRYFFLPKKL